MLIGFSGFLQDFPSGSEGKASACSAGDPGLIPGLGRCPGEGNDNPLQYSCLEESHGQMSLVGCKESDTTEQRHLHFHFIYLPIFAALVSVLCQGFLYLWRTGAAPCCGPRASHCIGFSCCGAQALGHERFSSAGRALGSWGTQACLFLGMRILPRPGIKPKSPALAGDS